jgi:prepilin-type N-terminal cleavage/methylation domain-containing protein
MKQKTKQPNQAGFTLIELMVVISLMAVLMGILTLDFNSSRGERNLVLAKNETITNLRKVQGYILSSRSIDDGTPIKYYIVTFNLNALNYTVDAIDNNLVYHSATETIPLPSGLKIARINSIEHGIGGGDVLGGGTADETDLACMQVIFSAPFGKMYAQGAMSGYTCDSSITAKLTDPVQAATLSQNTARIYLSQVNIPLPSPYIEIVPTTGQMTTH